MNEIELYYLSNLIRTYAVGLCLGVSTIAMTNYFYMVSKGHTEVAENNMMHIVYTVLRVGMVLALLTEISTFMYYYHVDNFIYWTDNPELLMRATIFSVIVVNAFAMQRRKITMWLGPVFAGGSWYAYFFFSVWIETESTYNILFIGYVAWLSVMFVFLGGLRLYLTRDQLHRMGDGSDAVNIVVAN
jgi:hypothetical protein